VRKVSDDRIGNSGEIPPEPPPNVYLSLNLALA
jgi:hypothetical protein